MKHPALLAVAFAYIAFVPSLMASPIGQANQVVNPSDTTMLLQQRIAAEVDDGGLLEKRSPAGTTYKTQTLKLPDFLDDKVKEWLGKKAHNQDNWQKSLPKWQDRREKSKTKDGASKVYFDYVGRTDKDRTKQAAAWREYARTLPEPEVKEPPSGATSDSE